MKMIYLEGLNGNVLRVMAEHVEVVEQPGPGTDKCVLHMISGREFYTLTPPALVEEKMSSVLG